MVGTAASEASVALEVEEAEVVEGCSTSFNRLDNTTGGGGGAQKPAWWH